MDFFKEYIVDIILILVFLINVYVYYKKSFVKAVLEFVSFFSSAFVTTMYSSKVSTFFVENTTLFNGDNGIHNSKIISAVLLFILISGAFKILIYYIDKLFHLPVINSVNKMLGLILGILIGFLMVGLCIALFRTLELSGYEPLIAAVENSHIVKVGSEIIAKCYPFIAEQIKKGV